jgi:pimeloyl-ACP methyl ester carboxylesterase
MLNATDAHTYLYLHGFASGPTSSKGLDLQKRFRACQQELLLPDLNQGDFTHLTLTRQIQYVNELLDDHPATLIGSSLGGLVAAWVAEKNPRVERLILLAPAFCFLTHWLERLGADQVQRWQEETYLSVYHYGQQTSLPLHYHFLQDAQCYPDERLQRPIPTLILHGFKDEIVPIQVSREYAANRPWVELIELDSDHGLGNVKEKIWQKTQSFCHL